MFSGVFNVVNYFGLCGEFIAVSYTSEVQCGVVCMQGKEAFCGTE